jgi:hypothetical protein
LIIGAKVKFDWDIDWVNLSAQFLRVKEFLKEKKTFPKYLFLFLRKKWKISIFALAKSFKKDIFK